MVLATFRNLEPTRVSRVRKNISRTPVPQTLAFISIANIIVLFMKTENILFLFLTRDIFIVFFNLLLLYLLIKN